MISNHSSVLFLYTSFIFCCYISLSTKLNTLLISDFVIIKCSDYGYLILKNSAVSNSSNISCPNQTEIFESQKLYIYSHISKHTNCNATTKSFSVQLYVTNPSLNLHENNNFTDEQIKLLSSTIDIDNMTYSFDDSRSKNSSRLLIFDVPVKWKSDNLYVFHIIFKEQPIACYFKYNSTGLVENGTCLTATLYYKILCYYEPLSKSPLKNVPWELLTGLVYTNKYSLGDWESKGRLYYDIRQQTTTTSTKTKTITSKVPKKTKPATTNFAIPKKSKLKKNSSSPSKLLILVLILLLCGIIAVVLFVIYRSRQNVDQTLLNRVDSEESNNSEITTDLEADKSQVDTNRRGGRVMNQLDPDME